MAVLFCRSDSVYRTFPEAEVYDLARDALTYPGGLPVVAHPPCRLWSRLRRFSTAPLAEQDLAVWAVEQVRRYGGVLEHPFASKLWSAMVLPKPGQQDSFGGFTLPVLQFDFGHLCRKATWLYICGMAPSALPVFPVRLDSPRYVVPNVSKKVREATPVAFARWLLDLALTTRRSQ